jgi:predicted negative regulator of RcsB-dependent stress response
MLMLGVLFSMVGAFGWNVWRAVKRAESLEE